MLYFNSHYDTIFFYYKESATKRTISLILALVLCLSLCACGSSGKSDKNDVGSEIKITVQSKAAAYCMVNYKDVKNVIASVTDTEDNGDGTYDVKGYITVTDDYGDKYKAKFTAVVAIDDEGDGKCKSFNMDTPKKS